MTIDAQLNRAYWLRTGFVSALCAAFGLSIGWFGLRHGSRALAIFAIVLLLILPGVLFARDFFRSVKRIDDNGIDRRDGERFLWKHWESSVEIRGRMPDGSLGPLNHLELKFTGGGSVRVFPLILENAGPVLQAIARRTCKTCGRLPEYSHGSQKGGREQEDTYLPAEAAHLVTVKETCPGENRSPLLQKCPQCGAWFVYETAYEFLVSGSEEDQFLTRLTDAEAAKYLP